MKTAGHISTKKGFYYTVLPAKDKNGKKTTKWERTGLKVGVEGNDVLAQQMPEDRQRRESGLPISLRPTMLFSDFMNQWLLIIEQDVRESTMASYRYAVERVIVPYFEKTKIALNELKVIDLENFYRECRNQRTGKNGKKVSVATTKHYHANIHKALKYAFKCELVVRNVADAVDIPRQKHFTGDFYTSEEIQRLMEVVAGHKIEVAVYLGFVMGLRRSEVVGLKWDSVDFKRNTITIKHTVTAMVVEGKRQLVESDDTKTDTSLRELPMGEALKNMLWNLQVKQEENLLKYGAKYNKEFIGYVCVDEIGKLIRPDYLTKTFPELVKKNGLRRIRFHDLRHTCASTLLANEHSMFKVMQWFGHSSITLTCNKYGHLDFKSKVGLANTLDFICRKTGVDIRNGR